MKRPQKNISIESGQYWDIRMKPDSIEEVLERQEQLPFVAESSILKNNKVKEKA